MPITRASRRGQAQLLAQMESHHTPQKMHRRFIDATTLGAKVNTFYNNNKFYGAKRITAAPIRNDAYNDNGLVIPNRIALITKWPRLRCYAKNAAAPPSVGQIPWSFPT